MNFTPKIITFVQNILNMNYRLPAEWEPQQAIQLTWPHNATDWHTTMQEVTQCYISIARHISKHQNLWIVTPEPQKVERLLRNNLDEASLQRITYYRIPTNDTWARDHGFITLVPNCGNPTEKASRLLLDFRFNAWGGKFEATLDNAVSRKLFDTNPYLADDLYEDNLDFELEGGSIESDGHGTILTTAQCNLNANRRSNTNLSYIEQELKRRLRADRILWLHHGGLQQDDTDAHIDTLARFCPRDTIVYSEGCPQMLHELQTFRTPLGKPYNLVPIPEYYANFLIINGAVLLPFYQDSEKDQRAQKTLQSIFPDREIIGIDCSILLTQNGSLHCCTMQYPRL